MKYLILDTPAGTGYVLFPCSLKHRDISTIFKNYGMRTCSAGKITAEIKGIEHGSVSLGLETDTARGAEDLDIIKFLGAGL